MVFVCNLLRTMAKHGSAERQKKLVKIAIGEGRPTLQEVAARALLLESISFDSSNLALIGDDELASVSPDVCLWLCMLLASIATENRLMQATKKFATNPDRRIFVTVVLLAIPTHRTEAQHDAIASFLPESVVEQLMKLVERKCSKNLSFLDELGDVQSVECIKVCFPHMVQKESLRRLNAKVVRREG